MTFQLDQKTPMLPEEVRGRVFLQREECELRQGGGEHRDCCGHLD